MKKFLKSFISVLWLIILWIWQLPQNILGILWMLMRRAKRQVFEDTDGTKIVWYALPAHIRASGVCLGNYIICMGDSDGTLIRHEYGHQIQSKRWGLLYLFVVGIPSAYRAGYLSRKMIERNKWNISNWHLYREWYYSAWPEDEADELGEVER